MVGQTEQLVRPLVDMLPGERAAEIYILIETAKPHGLDPEAYLRRVIERIVNHPVNCVAELLPWNLDDIRHRVDQRPAA